MRKSYHLTFMRESPPKSCPCCRYDFTGLPAAYRCPECGFEYDEHTIVWRARNPWRPMLAAAGFVLPTLMATWTTIRLVTGRYVGPGELFGTIAIFATVATFSIVIYRQNRRGRFVAINPVGVHGRAYYRDVVVPKLDQRGVRITYQHKSFGVTIPQVFDHEHDFADFRDAIALAIDRRAARQSHATT